jgi:ribosomal protein S18 acetylase RimI-like enzyme
MQPHWRSTTSADDTALIALCRQLYDEDPGTRPVPEAHMRRTLDRLREEPIRGFALALEDRGQVQGYALLISFWSNELGGEICTIDELYVAPELRSQGYGSGLIRDLLAGSPIWPRERMALDLEVTPTNQRARKLYAGLGFAPLRNAHLRLRF